MSGLIHLYYGDGKGKTTAAVGLAVRAAGSGMKVTFAQFMKNGRSSEVEVLSGIPGITTLIADGICKFSFKMTDEEKRAARVCQKELLKRALDTTCDMLVLDESINAYRTGLIDHDELEKVVLEKPEDLELVLTGRAPAWFFIERADYVTEMVCHKHPYNDGVRARRGVEF